MKTLIYAHAFAPSVGGAETYVMLLAQGLADSALGNGAVASFTVVTPTPANGFDDAALPFRVARRPGVTTLWRLIGEADVVQLAGPVLLPLALALLRRRPVVIEHHGYQAVCPNGLLLYEPTKTACPGHFMARRYPLCLRCNARTVGWRRSAAKLLLTFPRRWLARHAAANAPITKHVDARLGLPRSRVIYYGIPDPLAATAGAARRVHQPARPGRVQSAAHTAVPVCFAYVGRLVSEKGLPLLIEAAGHLWKGGYRFRLRFVGDGPERPRLEALAQARGLAECASFGGFLTGVSLGAALEDVTAVVMPSVWEETAGLAAIEQMMRGRLVIASDIGGLGEVVDGAGLTFAAGDVGGLAACMRRVLDEPSLVREVGGRARARALELFAQRRMVSEHAALYASLTGGSQRGT